MLQRVMQLAYSMTAKVTFADVVYVKKKLNDEEQKLFFRMSIEDQKHCIRVASTAMQLSLCSNIKINEPLLLKAALLHDIGKRNGDMDIWLKVVCVLLDCFSPDYAKKTANEKASRGSLAYALYIYYNHPQIGAQRIRDNLGLWNIAYLVEKHHSAIDDTAPPELIFLQKADGLN